MSRPGWLTYSGRFTHISGHPSAAGRAQDSESSPVRDRRSSGSTTVPRNQPTNCALFYNDTTSKVSLLQLIAAKTSCSDELDRVFRPCIATGYGVVCVSSKDVAAYSVECTRQ